MLALAKKFCWVPVLLLAVGLLACLGCFEERKLVPTGKTKPAAVILQLLVLGDPELAHAVGLLKSEWHARTGSTFEVSEGPDEPLGDLSNLKPDAIVCRAARLGELVESDQILPLPKDVLASDELAWSDVFPLIQDGEAAYGDRMYAIPLGAPVLTLCYRRDLFEKFDRKPPQTWQEYQAESKFFSDRQRLGQPAAADETEWRAALEPLATGWSGQMLLARSAAYARHRDNYSTLFNIEDFNPLVDQPPFVRALEEMVAAAKSSRGDSESAKPRRLDPAGVRSALLAGGCAMAITWPTAAGEPRQAAPLLVHIGFAELPGSLHSFNFAQQAWDTRTADEPIHLPLAPIAGRIGVVAKESANSAAAFRLLSWLSGPTWGTQVAASSSATTLYRRSQAAAPQKWIEPGAGSSAAKEYAAVVGQSLGRPVWMHALRIPGWQEYQGALDVAVEQALAGEKKPAEALLSAAGAWRQISERLGVEGQLRAYRRSLGLD